MMWTYSQKISARRDDTLRVMLCLMQDTQINSAIWKATIVGDKRAFEILTQHYRKRGYNCGVHKNEWKRVMKYCAEAKRAATVGMRYVEKERARIAREVRNDKATHRS